MQGDFCEGTANLVAASSGDNLEDRTATVSTRCRRSKKISFFIQRNSPVRPSPVFQARERVEYGLMTGCVEFKCDAATVIASHAISLAAKSRCAIEITLLISDHARIRKAAVRSSGEAV